jgi:predicted ATPase
MRSGAYGSVNRRTYGMMGDDVNLAARLMQAAQPGQILVNQSVLQGIESQYQWEGLPALRVKGKAEPVEVYGLLGRKEKPAGRVLEAKYALPMVGRGAELADIRQRMEGSLRGYGQLVGITGEAGVGKTRLVSQAIQIARQNDMIVYQGECQSYGTNTSYLVWQSIWRDFFGLDPADPLEAQVKVLEKRLVAFDPALVARLPLLGVVLNLPIRDNELTRAFDAKLRKASLEALLVACLRAHGREFPCLLVLEDCQWIDPLSHDLLEVIGRAIANVKVIILMAYRLPLPENLQAPRVSWLPNFHEIHLDEFSHQEAEQLIGLKLGQVYPSVGEIPLELVRLVTDRAQGNPFYIEELLNYLRDRGSQLPDLEALQSLDLPTSLHSLILSRIDRLSESQKITLKVASVIGRLFRAAMLWGSYPQLGDSQEVISNLRNLMRLELVELDTPEPELIYLFKHILTQEVAYESLPFATRAMLHEQIGQYIERAYANRLDQFIDLLAYHYDRTLNQAKRREYLAKAGEAAQRNYANSAAIDYYQRLLPLLRPDDKTQTLLKLGKVYELTGRWSEAERQYQGALDLADQLRDRSGRAWVQTAQGELMRKQGLYARSAAWLEQALYAFEDLGDRAGVGQALHYAGTLAAQQGNYNDARQLYEQSLVLRRELGDKPQTASLLSNLGIIARFQGDYDAARQLHDEGLAIRRDLGDKWGIAVSLNNLGNVALDQGNLDEARSLLEEALGLQREVGDRWSVANALNNLGNLARAQGDFERALSQYIEGVRTYEEFGDKRALAYLLEDMGCLAALQDRPQRALQLIGSASRLRQEVGAPLSSTELQKIDSFLAKVHRDLDEMAQATAYGRGRSMTQEEAIQFAVEDRLG